MFKVNRQNYLLESLDVVYFERPASRLRFSESRTTCFVSSCDQFRTNRSAFAVTPAYYTFVSLLLQDVVGFLYEIID